MLAFRREVLVLALCALAIVSGCSRKADAPAAAAPAVPSEIRVAVAPTSPPMLFEENGKLAGIDIELFEGYCKKRGCTLKVTNYDFAGMLGAVSAGQADVAFSGVSITEKRREVMDFSQPYYDNAWHLVRVGGGKVKIEELADLAKYSIGYPRGMAYSDLIRNEFEPKGYYKLENAKLYPSYNEVLADLRNGNLDLAFMEEPVLMHYRKESGIVLESARAFTGFDQLGFAFAKGSTIRPDFDAYLKELGPDKIREVVDRWMK